MGLWLSWESVCLAHKRSWVQIPSAPLETDSDKNKEPVFKHFSVDSVLSVSETIDTV